MIFGFLKDCASVACHCYYTNTDAVIRLMRLNTLTMDQKSLIIAKGRCPGKNIETK